MQAQAGKKQAKDQQLIMKIGNKVAPLRKEDPKPVNNVKKEKEIALKPASELQHLPMLPAVETELDILMKSERFANLRVHKN